MLLVEEQRSLIEKFVKANKNFFGNEDLFEDFCSEAFQKSYMMFNSSANIQRVESYVSKVVHTSILSVLKDSGRIRRSSEGYVPTKEVQISEITSPIDVETKPVDFQPLDSNFVLEFPDPRDSVEEVLITKDTLQKISDAVCVIHKEVPSQMFLDIFYLRYVKSLKQADIAKSLNLSQSEVSKRLMQLSKLISNFLDGGSKR